MRKSKQIVSWMGVCIVSCMQMSAAPAPMDNIAPPPLKLPAPIHNRLAPDTLSSANLLADGYTIETAAEADARMARADMNRVLEAERLNYPAIDLYGENSWTNHVNPFAGTGSPKVPATYDIDCTGFVMPLEGQTDITSRYGYRKRYRRQHKGIDLNLRTGDPIRAAFDGKVRISDYERGGYGHYVVIRHPNGLETVYAHMSGTIAKEGQVVRAGEIIGKGGSTGRSTGPHLHFETRFMGIDINPERIIDFSVGAPLSDYYTFIAPKGYQTYALSDDAEQPRSQQNKKYTPKREKVSHSPKIYRVQKGDTLSSIAKKTGVSVRHLCRSNNMSSKATLRVGQPLKY